MADFSTKPKSIEPRWLDVMSAARHCGIGHNLMREIFRRQDFPVKWIGNKQVVYDTDLDKYIKEGRAS